MTKRKGAGEAAPKEKLPETISRPAANPPAAVFTAEDALTTSRQSIINALPEMTNQLIEHAKKGNSPAAKFLVDFAGLSAAPRLGKSPEEEESLAELLLKELHAEQPDDDSEEIA